MTDSTTTAARTTTDAAEGRAAVIQLLRRRWLGPFSGPAEVLDRNPVYAYLVGALYPVEVGEVTRGFETADEESLDPVSADAGGEADGGGDEGEPDSEEEDLGVNITGAFGWAPQSFGTTFLHRGTRLSVRVTAGVYVKEATAGPANDSDGRAVKSPESWRRTPLDEVVSVDITGNGSTEVFGRRGRLSWRTRVNGDAQLTTVSLSNAAQVAAGEAKRHAELCLFQSAMEVTDEAGLLPYPQGGADRDPESRELIFRYRAKPVFAIGHGIAVDWDGPAPTRVWTETIPQVENSAIRAKSGESEIYTMRRLSAEWLDSHALAAELRVVGADYREFIARQRSEAEQFEGGDRAVADEIVQRQVRAVERIEEGISLLAEGGHILTAFRMANTAMRWQMLRQNGLIDADARYGARLDVDHGDDEPSWRPFQLAFTSRGASLDRRPRS